LEAAIRKHVLQIPNVRAIPGCDVTGLLTSENNARVTGVRLKKRQNGGEEQTMSADLVVDAGGRGSRSPAWLEALGYQRAPEAEVKVNLGYTSRYYRRPKDVLPGINGIVLMAQPPNKRLGVLTDQDHGRWVVTLGGYLGDHAPTDPRDFTEFARSPPTPDIYNLISRAEPLGDPVAYKFSANLRRFYEKLAHFPQGYLIIGDAICSFNPTYGQGMTVAALEAVALGEWLAETGERSAQVYFKKIAKIVDSSWQITVGNDLRFPAVQGLRTPPVRFFNWYFEKLHHAAHIDSQVSVAFLKVINMVAPPKSILHPRIVSKVISDNLWPARRRKPQGSARYEPLKDLHTTAG
jgi:2-polyprenyl-6-methoxyphenol hydroxylase-like FAD-dependent oxidoreductase